MPYSAPSGLPSAMRAAVYRERGVLEIEPAPVPEPGAGELLLRVSHCGVCGTDLHLVIEGWGRPGSIGGHEYSGHVVAVGPRVTGFAVGDAVVGGPEPGCGRCDCCLAGRPGLCSARPDPVSGGFQGAFAEYKRVRAAQLLPVPEGVSVREAALCEPLAVALHGITLSGIRPGERALVLGAGPIGMLTLAALLARGVEDVTVSEPSEPRRELARRVGARRVVLPDALPVPPMPFSAVDEPYHVSFECSGRPEAFESALGQLCKTGRLVIVGTGMERPRLDANRVLMNELVVTGAYNYDENGFRDALSLLASGRLPTRLLLEADDVSLERLLGAMEGLAAGRIAGKVLVAP